METRKCWNRDGLCGEECGCYKEQDRIEVELDLLATKAGMVVAGRNKEGNMEYIGTKKQWEEFTRLMDEDDE